MIGARREPVDVAEARERERRRIRIERTFASRHRAPADERAGAGERERAVPREREARRVDAGRREGAGARDGIRAGPPELQAIVGPPTPDVSRVEPRARGAWPQVDARDGAGDVGALGRRMRDIVGERRIDREAELGVLVRAPAADGAVAEARARGPAGGADLRDVREADHGDGARAGIDVVRIPASAELAHRALAPATRGPVAHPRADVARAGGELHDARLHAARDGAVGEIERRPRVGLSAGVGGQRRGRVAPCVEGWLEGRTAFGAAARDGGERERGEERRSQEQASA